MHFNKLLTIWPAKSIALHCRDRNLQKSIMFALKTASGFLVGYGGGKLFDIFTMLITKPCIHAADVHCRNRNLQGGDPIELHLANPQKYDPEILHQSNTPLYCTYTESTPGLLENFNSLS